MKFTVKKRMSEQVVYNDKKQVVGEIQHKKGDFVVLDKDEKQQYRISEKDNNIVIISGKSDGDGKLTLSQTSFGVKPAMVCKLEAVVDGKTIDIVQAENRQFNIEFDGNNAEIVSLSVLNPEIIFKKDIDTELVALLYALCLKMYHEDDIEIL